MLLKKVHHMQLLMILFSKLRKTILVDDCLLELQALASHYRKDLKVPVLAITGTNGKTTTKELLSAIMSKKLRVHYTHGNLNNHIGVPLTILSAPERYRNDDH